METMPRGTRSLLEKCASQFSYYAAIHRAKESYEGNLKAKENQRFVDEIRKLLDGTS